MRLFLFEIDGSPSKGDYQHPCGPKAFVLAQDLEGALAAWRENMHLPEWETPLAVKLYWNYAFLDFRSCGFGPHTSDDKSIPA